MKNTPSATPAGAAPAASPKRAASLWILGAWQDLLLFVGTPLLILPLFWAAQSRMSIEDLALYVMAFGALGHHLPGMMRAYGDRALFQRFRARFIVAPLFLGAVCVAFTIWELSVVTMTAYIWGVWHGLMQTYGFMRIYDAKSASISRRTARLDFAMCFAWFGAGIVLSPTRLYRILELYHIRANGPLPSEGFIANLQSLWAAAMVAITLMFVWNLVQEWRAGTRPSPVKLILMATSFGFWWYSNVFVKSMLVGVALFEVFHDVQYLSIVWIFNRGRVEKDRTVGGFTRFLFRRSGSLLGVYVGMVFAYGSLHLVAQDMGSDTAKRALLGLLTGSALLHFYYDSFIWKVREKSTRQSLGIKGGAADAIQPAGTPGWLQHGARWALFVVPACFLGFTEPGARAFEFERTQALASVIPDNPQVHKELGDAFMKRGETAQAVEQFRIAIEKGIESAATQHNLGLMLARQGNTGEALARFEEALRLRPNAPGTHDQIAALLAARGKRDEAAAHYREALRLDARDAEAHHGLAALLAASGDLDEAAKHYGEALRSNPNAAPTHLNLGALLANQGKRAEAREHYLAAVRIKPNLAEAHYNMGALLEVEGDAAQAAAAYERAARARPDFTLAAQALERLRSGGALGATAAIATAEPSGEAKAASDDYRTTAIFPPAPPPAAVSR